jgi:hypothetical protein
MQILKNTNIARAHALEMPDEALADPTRQKRKSLIPRSINGSVTRASERMDSMLSRKPDPSTQKAGAGE